MWGYSSPLLFFVLATHPVPRSLSLSPALPSSPIWLRDVAATAPPHNPHFDSVQRTLYVGNVDITVSSFTFPLHSNWACVECKFCCVCSCMLLCECSFMRK